MLSGRVSKVVFVMLFCAVSCLCYVPKSHAMFVDMHEARIIVENWLNQSNGAISDQIGGDIREAIYYHGGIHGEPGYYVFFLEPNGWVVIPADDSFEVIRAFGAGKLTPKDYAKSSMPYFLRVKRVVPVA